MPTYKKGNSIIQAALSIISTIIGGGIIPIPYAMYAPGFQWGLQIHMILICIMVFCTHLYIEARDRIGFETISELCYMCFGRSSVFMINLLVAFVIFGILTLYLLLLSRISISMISPLIGYQSGYNQDQQAHATHSAWYIFIFNSKVTYILLATFLLFPVLLKRNLSELKF